MRIKKLFLTVCLSLMPVLLCACHGSKGLEPFTVPESFDETKQYEITFWAKNDTNKIQTAIYEKAIADFEKLYPSIKVNMRLYTDYGRIYNDVITNISTNTTPNVCITYPDHIATYLTGTNICVPLDDLFVDEKYGLGGSEIIYDAPSLDEVIPKFLEECKLGEHYYAVPYMRSSECVYINKTLVEKLGYEVPDKLTWDFIWEVSDEATKQDADGNYLINGQKVMIPFIYKSTDNFMIQSAYQRNVDFSDAEGGIYLFNDETKDFLYTIAEHTAKGSFSTFKISSYPGNFLNAGQCIFAIDSTAGATWMGSKAPNLDIAEDKLVDYELVLRPLAQYDWNAPKMISQGPSICIFNKEDNNEVLASWLFTQFLLTNDVQIAYSETEGYIPVTKKALESAEYTDYLSKASFESVDYYAPKIYASKICLENIDNTIITPVFNGSASLRDASGQLIENVTKSVNRHETVDETYMEKLYKDVKSLYHLDSVKQANTDTTQKADLGKLPVTAVILLSSLALVWVLIAVSFFYGRFRRKYCKK